MPATYEPIATTTLGATATQVIFSSIPATYTDLRLAIVATNASTANLKMQYNSDTATNYSQTLLTGTGTAAQSTRQTSTANFEISGASAIGSTPTFQILDIFSYAGSTNKTALASSNQDLNGSGDVTAGVYLYRSTSAITSIRLFVTVGNLAVGSIFSLYGIKAA